MSRSETTLSKREKSWKPKESIADKAQAALQLELEHCSGREDQIHCVHWWDGEKCCGCGSETGDVDGE